MNFDKYINYPFNYKKLKVGDDILILEFYHEKVELVFIAKIISIDKNYIYTDEGKLFKKIDKTKKEDPPCTRFNLINKHGFQCWAPTSILLKPKIQKILKIQ